MLVLTRKKNERVIIGNDIEVVVVEIRGDRVKLGFVGPDNVPIDREEVARATRGWGGLSTARMADLEPVHN